MTTTNPSDTPVEKFVDTMKEITTRPKNELQYIMHGLPDDTAVEVANNTLNELRKNGPDVAETIAAELGQAYGPNDAAQTGSELVSIAAGTSKTWLGRVLDVVKGYFSTISSAIHKWWWGSNGTVIDKLKSGDLEAAYGMLATAGLHMAELVALVYIVYKIRKWLFPQLAYAWKCITAGKPLAKCTFKTTDGEAYACIFDSKKKLWVLKRNRGLKTLLHKSDLFLDQDTCASFAKTDFFKRFSKQCRKYIAPFLDSKQNEARLQASTIDSNQKKCLQYLIAAKPAIEENMFKNKFGSL